MTCQEMLVKNALGPFVRAAVATLIVGVVAIGLLTACSDEPTLEQVCDDYCDELVGCDLEDREFCDDLCDTLSTGSEECQDAAREALQCVLDNSGDCDELDEVSDTGEVCKPEHDRAAEVCEVL